MAQLKRFFSDLRFTQYIPQVDKTQRRNLIRARRIVLSEPPSQRKTYTLKQLNRRITELS